MGRISLGVGQEHQVFESSIEGWVLKRPKLIQTALLNILYSSPGDVVRQEIVEIEKRFEAANIHTPQTRVFPVGRGYIIAQKRIVEDNSISSGTILENIKKCGDLYIDDYYQNNPKNFSSNSGRIYCLDPTLGYFRVLDRLGIMGYETQARIRSVIYNKIGITSLANFLPAKMEK